MRWWIAVEPNIKITVGLSLLVVALATHRAYSQTQSCSYVPPSSVTEHYDRFRDETIIELDRLGFGAPIQVEGTGACYFSTNLIMHAAVSRGDSAQPQITWTFVTLVAVQDPHPDVILLLDGAKRFPLEVLSVERRTAGNMVAYHITAEVPVAAMRAVVAAALVEVAVGRVELTMSPQHLSAVREFASRLNIH